MSIREQVDFGITLTRELAAWVKEQRSLGKAVPNGKFLFEMYVKKNDRLVLVFLNSLSYRYYAKFVAPDVEDYCVKLLRAIEPCVFNSIACEIEPYTSRFEFEHKDGILVKHVRYSFASMIY
ncbi:hypothetical protein [Daejeonella lutea]|uniref:Uncharacterized protein n=1 Tax=Daejeonella lutea TaxID=572036 RepID=A0A1T5CXF7_9SPHI|nr:hypothetical protein [Daejeonella lutea]SKB64016.1 hypothetical protein SAMN05661099_1983 [Daejeonella lutea]